MRKQIFSVPFKLLLLVMTGVFLAACGSSSPATTSAGGTTSGSTSAGQILLQQHCTVCHSANRITSAHHPAAEWKNTVDRMISKGAQLSSTEEQTLVNYLAQNYK
jgi:mono/diheme cytochrome c family protein